jgi:uncharacterized protein YhbP (UPF0306 family)
VTEEARREDTHQAIRSLLEAHNTLTLATCDQERPWAATVFFCSDRQLRLYFVSDHRTRHGRDMAANSRVAAAVNPDCSNWGEVRGVQLEGQVEVVDGLERLAALKTYLAKFPDVRAMFERPRDKNEETIGQRLKAANIYRLTPDWLRLIDNSRWFGYKEELRIDP